ncbi:MAG: DUF362 domain-containing protein [Elusimicrobiota bacterium]
MVNVYFIKISELEKIGELINTAGIADTIHEGDLTALKVHFGEKNNKGYLKPEFIKPVVDTVKHLKAQPFLTDACTIYVGQRAVAPSHLTVAHEHGFSYDTYGCPVIIADGLRGNSYVEVPVNLKHFRNVKVAHDIHYSDSMVVLSHLKGHEISGFGGAIKNLAMGCAARAGKYEMHNDLKPEVDTALCTSCKSCVKWCPASAIEMKPNSNGKVKAFIDPRKCIGCGECILACGKYKAISIKWSESVTNCQEKMVEYACGAVKNKRMFYINYINFVTKFCDCYPTKEGPVAPDVGILAGTDPVAVDLAAIEVLNKTVGYDFFNKIWPEINWKHNIEYATKCGLGSDKYELKIL